MATVSLWPTTAPGTWVDDQDAVTLGTVFDTAEEVDVTGVRFHISGGFPNIANSTPETVGIFRYDGTLVVSAPYTGSPFQDSWHVAPLPTTRIPAGRYIAAAHYNGPSRFAFTSFYFDTNSPSNPPLSAPLSGGGVGNGRFLYGAALTFPTNTFQATNYWIDPVANTTTATTTRVATSWTSSYTVRRRAAAAWTSSYAVRRRAAVSWTSSYVTRARIATSWRSSYQVRSGAAPTGQNTRLVLPYDVEGLIVDVLRRRHPEHLAKMERARGLQPQTFQQFQTIVRMSDAGAIRLSGDTTPACLLGVIGAPDLVRNENNNLDATFQLGMQITVFGQKRSDTIYRRDVMAWTAVECLLQRLPRSSDGLIHSVRLTDYEPLAEVETQRTVGDARLVFEVGVTDFMSITGFLPGDDSAWPAEAGGAPRQPYDPIAPRPSATPTFELERTPIVE